MRVDSQRPSVSRKTPTTPFVARFPKAWEHGSNHGSSPWQHYVRSQGWIGGRYRPSYCMLTWWECEQRADICLHLMDCYGPDGSHHHQTCAAAGFIRAQAAAISWLSR